MKYTIHNLRHEVHDLAHDSVDFRFEIHFTEPDDVIVNQAWSYHSFCSYLHDKQPEFYKYLCSIRESIDGWGPCEDRIFEAMEEESLHQLYEYFEAYLMQADWISKALEQHLLIISAKPEQQMKIQQGAERIVAEANENIQSLNQSHKRYLQFCETVQRQIRETATEVYPELIDGDAEQLREFKELFGSDIRSMYKRIENMLLKISKRDVNI
jgi:hypothetical protein